MEDKIKSEVLSKKIKTTWKQSFLQDSLIRLPRLRSCQAVYDKIRTDNIIKVKIQVDVLHNNHFSEAPKIFINTAIGRTILSQEGFLLVVCSWGQEAGTIVKALKQRQVPAFYSLCIIPRLRLLGYWDPPPAGQCVRAAEFGLQEHLFLTLALP